MRHLSNFFYYPIAIIVFICFFWIGQLLSSIFHFFGLFWHQTIFISILYLYWIHHKHHKILCLLAGACILIFPSVRVYLFQSIYGQPSMYDTPDYFDASITLLSEQEEQSFERNGYAIKFTPRAQIDISARVVYLQYNDTYFSSFDYYSSPVYDTISPLDVSVFIKSMADNWEEYDVDHEKRALFVRGHNTRIDEYQNLHVIPATESIYKGFSTIKRGDAVSLKGFLIDWYPVDNNKMFFKTSRSFGEASKERLGGQFTYLCMQFFVTELNANGYLFK